ncbi:MAG: YiiD C-terminal domain-containing protein [bacterium]
MSEVTRMGQIDSSLFPNLVRDGIPCVKRMGLQVVELAPRRVTLRMPLAGNENHIGIMYAGILFTIAEIPGGALFLSTFDITKAVPIVKGMDIRFKKPATTDVTITVEIGQEEVDRINRELEAQGKSDFVLNGQIKDLNGAVVCESKGMYQLRRI